MINKIIKGITDAIFTEFGDECEINTESVEQGLTSPCFFVSCINPSDDSVVGSRRLLSHLYKVQYFAKGPKINREINDVFDRMTNCLRMITVDGCRINATNATVNVSDGVMTYMVHFNMHVIEAEDYELMQELNLKGEIR